MRYWMVLSFAGYLISCSSTAHSPETADVHVAAAREAAGKEHVALFETVCMPASEPRPPAEPPTKSIWYREPVKVFDNLYFVGQAEHSAWAVTTSQGIIIVDAIWDYSIEDEIVGGLKKLGFDPATIKYVIVSHGHIDHAGGAKYLQDRFGARIILAEEDWDGMSRNTQPWPKPKRDMVALDGQKLTLGETTLTMYKTPGHTLGTLSTLIPVKDQGKPHLAVEVGGTAFNWLRGGSEYRGKPNSFWFETYSNSARRLRDIVEKAGADVLLSNHTIYDGSKVKLPALLKRKPGDPHPYVVGTESAKRYLTVADECAQAGLLRFSSPAIQR
jgi:metallo-beta-lactamase class B